MTRLQIFVNLGLETVLYGEDKKRISWNAACVFSVVLNVVEVRVGEIYEIFLRIWVV